MYLILNNNVGKSVTIRNTCNTDREFPYMKNYWLILIQLVELSDFDSELFQWHSTYHHSLCSEIKYLLNTKVLGCYLTVFALNAFKIH